MFDLVCVISCINHEERTTAGQLSSADASCNRASAHNRPTLCGG